MSKQRRHGPGHEQRPDEAGPEHKPDLDAELDHGDHGDLGHEVQRGSLGGLEGAAAALGAQPAPQLAERVALALRVAPRDAEWSQRLSALVQASNLSDERRAAVVERLQADQALADDVAVAVTTWLGADSDAQRSELVRAFDDAARALSDPASRGGPDPEAVVADAVARSLGADRAAPEAVAGLCRQLGVLLALLWDEEEEEGAAGDYAAEESGS